MVVSLSSPAQIAHYPPGATFGPRLLSDYEFVWLIEGDAHYYWQSEKEEGEMALPQGSVLLCRPPYRDRFVWDKTHRTRHGFFHFSIDEIGAPWPPPDQWPWKRSLEAGDLLDVLSRHLIGGASNTSDVALMQQNLAAATFLAAFLSGDTGVHSAMDARLPEPVERAVAFIYEQTEKESAVKLELESIARAAYVSPEYLCRLFKKSLGYSPMETARLIRVERALLLLSRSNYSVGQVARLTGFESPFHFSRVVKKVYGLTPHEIQIAAKAGENLPPSPLRRLWNPNQSFL